jgi:circadian clock protein KaiC
MKQKIRLFPSGISLVDSAWGGLYRGGTYLLIGPHKSGKTLLGLQFAYECAKQKEVCLYFTNMRPKELLIHAASIDFDLQYYMNQNLVIVVRVSPPPDSNEQNSDKVLVEYLSDINNIVTQYQPVKIVFDEFTPFVGFTDIKLLQDVFLNLTESLEEASITSLFILAEPAGIFSRNIVNSLSSLSTGLFYFDKSELEEMEQRGTMKIIPNIGHTEGRFEAPYRIEPYKGIVVLFRSSEKEPFQEKHFKEEKKYKSLSELTLPEENFTISNIYNLNDFTLILNNQIAVYKSTKQEFSIISIRLNPEAEKKDLITINQLTNAVRLAADKKDKICVVSNKIIVMVIKEDQKGILNLIVKIKSNLPGDHETQKKIIQYISVYAIKVDETIQNSEDILNEIVSDEQLEKKRSRLI